MCPHLATHTHTNTHTLSPTGHWPLGTAWRGGFPHILRAFSLPPAAGLVSITREPFP